MGYDKDADSGIVASPPGLTVYSFVQFPYEDGETRAPRIYWGAGTPEAACTGRIGDVYLRTNGGAGTTLYIKETGANTKTGWDAK